MLHIFARPEDLFGEELVVTGEEVNHKNNVLRLRPGEEVSVSDGEKDLDYRYEVVSYREDAAILHRTKILPGDTELPVRPYLFQGLPKGEKMELIVHKAVELGVY